MVGHPRIGAPVARFGQRLITHRYLAAVAATTVRDRP